MAKSKSKFGLSGIVMCVAALLGVVAIIMMAAPGVAWKNDAGNKLGELIGQKDAASGSFGGFALMFGGKAAELGGTTINFKFNIVTFLPFVFLLVGIVGVILSVLLHMNFGKYLAIGGFLLAGIFFFLFNAALPMSIQDVTAGGKVVATGKEQIETLEKLGFAFSLGVGAIVAGVLSILAALASAAATFALKK